ncbi:MAG: hypothetical protein GY809_27070 [Planctomycetes bacterium]|nr:hypothetical protein [Planctomycetota bacterium]
MRRKANDKAGAQALSRRDFMHMAGATATGLILGSTAQPTMAGPFDERDFQNLVPADKKLSGAWIKSLHERSAPQVYRGNQLKYIGMPVGGMGCGQLYLGGDGRLWLWDIYKSNYRREPDHGQRIAAFTLGGHYANPVAFGKQYTRWNGTPVEQGFLLRAKSNGKAVTRTLDKHGFSDVTFRGEYPIGKVTYQDQAFPAKVRLEAFSPFIPTHAKDSSLPATVMSYTVTNTSGMPIEIDLGGWMQNATCPFQHDAALGHRINRVVQTNDRVSVLSTIEAPAKQAAPKPRKNIVVADFETDDWDDWIGEGDAFKGGPFPSSAFVPHQKVSGYSGKKLANSFNTRIEPVSGQTDKLTGTLTSPEFEIERKYIELSVCGGGNANEVYVEVLVEGRTFGKVTGHNSIVMQKKHIDVSKYQGKMAQLRIVDHARGGWGHITADQIVLTDRVSQSTGIEGKHGFGSSTLTLLRHPADVSISTATSLSDPDSPGGLFDQMGKTDSQARSKPLDELLVGGLTAGFTLKPGQSKTVDFVITWYFPHYNEIDVAPGQMLRVKDFRKLSRHYKPWFRSAGDVAQYIATNKQRLLGGTYEWNKTWYDSTLPHWLLDRSFIAIDCMATQMFHWFDNGRPYGWEGVDCCPGTCTHVWHYAQGLSRIFPEIERAFREEVDFKVGVGFDPGSGLISDRGDFHVHEATDGQAGTILRAYREHLMSRDDAFLRRLWPNIKKAVQFLIAKDPDRSGLIEGTQPHTLDAAWYGPMGWISGLYLGALSAGQAMASEMDDDAFARQCAVIVDRGRKNMVDQLFNGEYFIHKPDPKRRALQSGKGCHIDQVLGQAWMHQVGLDRVIPKKQTVSALNSLWKYNFTLDAGGYALKHRAIEKAFRWYAMEGEAGLLMCTWPKGGVTEAIPGDQVRPEKNPDVWTGPGGYFNECMNGFEYQVAWHMVAEGEPGSELVRRGLAIIRAIHDRYGADKRNPYNEIECSDHYARSMASYGVFLACSGFEYHGPKGQIGFAPKLSPDNFKAPFTAAEGWGTYQQKHDDQGMTAQLIVRYGRLKLSQIKLQVPSENTYEAKVSLDGQSVEVQCRQTAKDVVTELNRRVVLHAGQVLAVELS